MTGKLVDQDYNLRILSGATSPFLTTGGGHVSVSLSERTHLLSVLVSPSVVSGSVVAAQAPLRICCTSAGLSRAKSDRPRPEETELLSGRP